MRLAWRITTVFLLGIFIVLACGTFVSVHLERKLYLEDVTRDHLAQGHSLTTVLSRTYRQEGMLAVNALLDDTNHVSSSMKHRWVWLDTAPDSLNRPHAPAPLLQGLTKTNPFFWNDPSGVGWVRSYFLLETPEGRPAALEISESLDPLQQQLHAIIAGTLLAFCLLFVVAGLVVVAFGVRFVGRPVQSLMNHAREIANGNLAHRVDDHRRDEIGELGVALNQMSEQLEESRRAVQTETEERVKVVEQLRRSDRLSRMGTLASGMAHELGTPINVISGRAKMLAREKLESEEIRENGRIISEQADRITQILRQLMDFSRPRKSERAELDLAPIVEHTVTVMQGLAQQAKIEIRFDRPSEAVTALIDPVQIQQVLTNLIMNGIQAMKNGGRIHVSLFRMNRKMPPGEFVVLRVADEGAGIPADAREHVFEPFFTTKDVGEGTGLGLAVSYGVVQEHGGWIEVESAVGRGSSFSVHLPAARRS